MSGRREIRCRCGRWMWAQPGVGAVQCSNCHTVTQFHSLVEVVRSANRMIHGLQQLRRQHQQPQLYEQQQMMVQPQLYEQQQMMAQPQLYEQQQMMAQPPPPPPRLLEPLPSPFGKKRAVLCGLNYRGKSYSLKGCISDAKSMRCFLVQQMGFPIESILMLTEDEASPQRIPTKKNIRKAMRWLVEGNRARDSLVFHYSGHGSQQKDYNGDEVDGQDEALAPLDHETEGKIIDDEINKILVRPLVHGAKLHAVIDACNSGTVLDLSFVCRMERYTTKISAQFYLTESEKKTCEKSGMAFMNGNIKNQGELTKEQMVDQLSVSVLVMIMNPVVTLLYVNNSSSSYNTSLYVTWIIVPLQVFTGKNAGAMTYSFIKAVKTAGPAPTYGHLLNLMCSAIREAQSRLTFDGNYTSSDESAEPLLTSSEEFDIYATKFVL